MSVKQYYFVQYGLHQESNLAGISGEEFDILAGMALYGDEFDRETGIHWTRAGGYTDSLVEAEARATLAEKSYKNVRIVSVLTNVIETR